MRSPSPSLMISGIQWPVQYEFIHTQSGLPQVISVLNIQYYVKTSVISTAIIEWNIGIPVSGQIRQTSADRTDFAY